jgi:hypothetical protein
MMEIFAHGEAATHAAEKSGLPIVTILLSLIPVAIILICLAFLLNRAKQPAAKDMDGKEE